MPVPWDWHAPAPDTVDLGGGGDARCDLLGLLRLAAAAGLGVVLCPGPSGGPPDGPDGGGLPAWLPGRMPHALVLGPDGHPASLPGGPSGALLHPDFLRAVGAWFAALAGALEGPAGDAVVAWQVAGDAGAPFAGRIGALDFNPDTVRRYRDFLAARHESGRSLAREWGRPVEDIETIRPPGDARSPGEVSDWQAFLETLVAEHVSRLGELVRAAGSDLPLMTAAGDRAGSPGGPAPVAARAGFLAVGLEPGAGPAAATLAVLRAEAYATDERPPTAWALRDARDVLAAVAHGVKGYSLGADVPGWPGWPAAPAGPAAPLERLQHWLATAEEELTASVEVRDPLAYLEYPLYARVLPDDPRPAGGGPFAERFGLLALLHSCGYNPTLVDLAAATDAELTEFPAAVFPCRGALRLDDYGKLVVFTLRGGALTTFPAPAMRELDGTAINTRFLWPHRPADLPARDRLRRLLRHGPRRGLRDALAGTPLPAGRGVVTYPDAGRPFVRYGRAGAGAVPRAATEAVQAQVLLTAGGVPAGYRVQVRSGTSAVLGAFPGVDYAGAGGGGALTPGERLALRRFAVGHFEEVAPRRVAPEDALEVEAVARLSPDGGCLLFVLNRRGAQSGWLRFPAPEALNLEDEVHAAVLYSAAGSGAAGGARGVRLDLAPGDALVLRLTSGPGAPGL